MVRTDDLNINTTTKFSSDKSTYVVAMWLGPAVLATSLHLSITDRVLIFQQILTSVTNCAKLLTYSYLKHNRFLPSPEERLSQERVLQELLIENSAHAFNLLVLRPVFALVFSLLQ